MTATLQSDFFPYNVRIIYVWHDPDVICKQARS